ncbi:MAG: hypothetical protein Q9O74_05870 [Planctomycetota bacterium]|nr:hypothetical protein [Planctomycetota bacterium]
MMERASRHLVECEYFDAERAAARALRAARERNDFERMARICLPLQEARRQKRDSAIDTGPVALVRAQRDLPKPLVSGLYLLQPPMIGRDGRSLRDTLDRRRTPASVLTREPLTRTGKWPIVGVGPMVIRVQVDPPWPIERVETSMSKDDDDRVPPTEWFVRASEALGDAAIAALDAGDHPHYRVDDLLDFLDAHPEHEKLHQALADACRAAIGTDEPLLPRRRGLDEPAGF